MPDGIPGVRWDYFSEGMGGLRSMYANVRSLITLRDIQKIAGTPIFTSGPHSSSELNLEAKYRFGHYNPKFVKWLLKYAVPASTDKSFRRLTKPFYDSYFRDLARTYYAAYIELHAQPGLFKQEKQWLLDQLKNNTLPQNYYFRYEDILAGKEDTLRSPKIGKGGYRLVYKFDTNQAGTAAAFWLRRSIDGTDGDFFLLLRLLLETYDTHFIRLNAWKEPKFAVE